MSIHNKRGKNNQVTTLFGRPVNERGVEISKIESGINKSIWISAMTAIGNFFGRTKNKKTPKRTLKELKRLNREYRRKQITRSQYIAIIGRIFDDYDEKTIFEKAKYYIGQKLN